MQNKTLRPLVTLIALLLLASCARTPAEPPSSEAAQPIPIRVYALEGDGQHMETSAYTAYVERKYNVDLRWDVHPYEEAKASRQLSVASGTYPDAYILTAYIDQFSKEETLRYGKQGLFLPLNALIDKHAPNIKAAFEQNAVLRQLNTAPDGNIYGLVSYSDCYHCSYPNKMWLNAEWLDKLGLEMPRTTDDFKQVLQAFKTRDPNGNGKMDEIPLSGSIEDFGVRVIPYLMNGFIYDDDRMYVRLNDGRVEAVANKPEWREGLRYIRSLYEEGLIDPGAFAQSTDAYRRLGDNRGEVILGAGAAMHPEIFAGGAGSSGRARLYAPVPPLAGPYARYAVHDEGGIVPGAKFAITSKASPEAQVALIKMVDAIYTPEGQIRAESGEEGIAWRRPVSGEKALAEGAEPRFAFLAPQPGDPPNNSGWIGTGHFYMPKAYRNSWVQGDDIYAANGYERRLQQATRLYEGNEPKELFPSWFVWIEPEDGGRGGALQTNIRRYIEENALRFITGERSLDKDWDAYLEELNRIGLPAYEALLQKGYDAYHDNRINGGKGPLTEGPFCIRSMPKFAGACLFPTV
ncbi:extracellular solute-binding protein [Paenibacillus methanolicus]|uniref:Putative aldouronate transport system substrate-binding protein n=1 Tax=Paenibacillus methanolicus TaxID=582686 RepID=A0A5S5CH58_9BACL|nr:extracellular solute-binding protein [Paenibacillus methanolicus]TYP79100.1 putative aldouronate transport system substrate-binding protein [Paenibacillus methanolicus]